jgi:hypothetical protein
MRRISSGRPLYQRALAPATGLLMTFVLTACDLPGTLQKTDDSSTIAAKVDDVPSQPVSTTAIAREKLDIAAIEKALEPKEGENPPIPSDVELTPMEKAGLPDGNAELAIRYENAESLGESVVFDIDRRNYILKRDEKDPSRFAGMIDFDFDRFQEEQDIRKRIIAESKESKFDVFEGRELVAQEEFGFISREQLETARNESVALRILPNLIAIPPVGLGLDPAKTLMITDLSVVQDPERTFDICGNVGDPDGAWTFKTLMTNMANQSTTYVDPADFVEDWLQSWNTSHTINTFPVPARTRINAKVLNPWPRDSNGKLDLNQSPMRLLAIVNRVDLRKSSISSSLYGGGRGIPLDAGEGRFVFGVVDRNNNGGCSTMEFTVILEYKVPITQCTAVRSYAQRWVGLSNIALGSASFNPALQAITDQFTVAGAGGGRPNDSAISQIRTNEIALSGGYRGDIDIAPSPELAGRMAAIPFARPWELREFHLLGDHMLHTVSTENTPHHTWNNTSLLANFINSGIAAVPATYQGQPFLTGSTLNFSVADSAVWNATGVNNARRHNMSLKTCNACHGGETRDNILPALPPPANAETSFVHITTRNAGVESALSKFLVGNGSLSSPTTFLKPDPIFGAPTRSFGDLRRRQILLPQLAFGSCQATGALQEALFRQLPMVH